MKQKMFKFFGGRLYPKNMPGPLETPVLRDSNGEEYIAHCPPQYEILKFFNMGAHWRVAEVMEKKRCGKHYLLKNLRDESNLFECYKIARIQGELFRLPKFNAGAVSVPKIVDAGHGPDGANYVIEEMKYGIAPTPAVIDSMSNRERDKFYSELAAFLAKLHGDQNATELAHKLYREERACLREHLPKDIGLRNFIMNMPPEPTATEHITRPSDQTEEIKEKYSKNLSLVHGDLAPRNMILDIENKIHVIDWGNARCDAPFVEFDLMRSQTNRFGGDNIKGIAKEYIALKEREHKIACQNAEATQSKCSAKPVLIHRLPVRMRQR